MFFSATSRAATTTPEREGFVPGAYLTDGVHLYRVVRTFAAPAGESSVEPVPTVDRWVQAELEDCITLAVTSHTPDALWRMGLTIVEPMPDER